MATTVDGVETEAVYALIRRARGSPSDQRGEFLGRDRRLADLPVRRRRDLERALAVFQRTLIFLDAPFDERHTFLAKRQAQSGRDPVEN